MDKIDRYIADAWEKAIRPYLVRDFSHHHGWPAPFDQYDNGPCLTCVISLVDTNRAHRIRHPAAAAAGGCCTSRCHHRSRDCRRVPTRLWGVAQALLGFAVEVQQPPGWEGGHVPDPRRTEALRGACNVFAAAAEAEVHRVAHENLHEMRCLRMLESIHLEAPSAEEDLGNLSFSERMKISDIKQRFTRCKDADSRAAVEEQIRLHLELVMFKIGSAATARRQDSVKGGYREQREGREYGEERHQHTPGLSRGRHGK